VFRGHLHFVMSFEIYIESYLGVGIPGTVSFPTVT
jgi:hypothetical protein